MNVLTVQLPGGAEASATVVNHPNGGPVFSGPQIQPWTCQAGAVDAQCNQPAEYTLLYRRKPLGAKPSPGEAPESAFSERRAA